LIVALTTLALGLGTIVTYADLIFSDVEFLSEWYEVRIGLYKIVLPGWAIACASFAFGSFLFALGAMVLVNSKRRKGIRISSRAVKVASKVSGCSALVLSLLLLAGLLMVSAPPVVVLTFLVIFLMPSVALTL